MSVDVLRRRFTIGEYHRMGEAGILREDDRVELIDGEIVQMTPIGSRHAACVRRLNHILVKALGNQAVVSVQNPIAIHPYSEPQPDLALFRPRPDFYARGHPEPVDVLLIVEVADTTVHFDRSVKQVLYARAGIPEVWLVNLNDDILEDSRHPEGGQYREMQRFTRGQRVSCLVFPELTVAIDEILG